MEIETIVSAIEKYKFVLISNNKELLEIIICEAISH